jgi:hypothetical protein
MNNPTATIALQNVETSQATTGAIVAAAANVAEQTATRRVPLMIRTRKVVRLSPPIDNGFRPFRVF